MIQIITCHLFIQCQAITWTNADLRSDIQCDLNWNKNHFFQEFAFENIVCRIRPFCSCLHIVLFKLPCYRWWSQCYPSILPNSLPVQSQIAGLAWQINTCYRGKQQLLGFLCGGNNYLQVILYSVTDFYMYNKRCLDGKSFERSRWEELWERNVDNV